MLDNYIDYANQKIKEFGSWLSDTTPGNLTTKAIIAAGLYGAYYLYKRYQEDKELTPKDIEISKELDNKYKNNMRRSENNFFTFDKKLRFNNKIYSIPCIVTARHLYDQVQQYINMVNEAKDLRDLDTCNGINQFINILDTSDNNIKYMRKFGKTLDHNLIDLIDPTLIEINDFDGIIVYFNVKISISGVVYYKIGIHPYFNYKQVVDYNELKKITQVLSQLYFNPIGLLV